MGHEIDFTNGPFVRFQLVGHGLLLSVLIRFKNDSRNTTSDDSDESRRSSNLHRLRGGRATSSWRCLRRRGNTLIGWFLIYTHVTEDSRLFLPLLPGHHSSSSTSGIGRSLRRQRLRCPLCDPNVVCLAAAEPRQRQTLLAINSTPSAPTSRTGGAGDLFRQLLDGLNYWMDWIGIRAFIDRGWPHGIVWEYWVCNGEIKRASMVSCVFFQQKVT